MAYNLDQRITSDTAFRAAVLKAEQRALHSFFNQHVVEDHDAYFVAIDEGDYDALPAWMVDRVAHTVPGMMADDY
jgi:DNA-binding GntR family transcriptional regulator